MNSNWHRWIKSSVVAFMESKNRVDPILKSTVDFFVEGQKRANERSGASFEIRMDGPDVHEVSRDCYKIMVDISHIVSITQDEQDLYAFDRLIGLASAAYERCIPVYRYGTGPEDDQTFLFSLVRLDTPQIVTPYGIPDAETRLLQGSVTGRYYGYI